MKIKGRSWKERICALLMAAVLVLTGMLPGVPGTVSMAKGTDAKAGASGDSISITFNVNVENPKITVKDNESTEEPEIIEKNPDDGTYKYDFIEGKVYTYTVSKQGYRDIKVEDFAPTADTETTLEINMEVSPIELNAKKPISLEVDASQEVVVENKIEGAEYTCTSSNSDYVSIAESDNGWNLTAMPLTGSSNNEESVTITVENNKNSESATLEVKVKKISIKEKILSIGIDPNGGEDQNKITYKLDGFDNEIFNNHKPTGTLTFIIDELEKGTVNLPETSFTHTLPEGVFEGNQKVKIIYSGDDRYESVSVTGDTEQFLKVIPLELTENAGTGKEITYGDEEFESGFEFPINKDTVAGRNVIYSIAEDSLDNSETPVATVDKEGNITPMNAGTVTICATAEKKDNIASASVNYTVTIKKKDLEIGDITWNAVTKVYDGDQNLKSDLTGTYINDNNEEIVIAQNNATFDKKGVEAQGVSIKEETYKLINRDTNVSNYQLIVSNSNNKIDKIATITHRPLYLVTEGITLSYGQNLTAALEKAQEDKVLIHLKDRTGEDGENTGLVEGEEISDSKLPKAILEDVEGLDKSKLYVNSEGFRIIVPNITDEKKYSGNYEFMFKDDGKGTLTVTKQELDLNKILSYIRPENANGIYSVLDEINETDGTKSTILSKIWASVKAKDWDGAEKENPNLKMEVYNNEYYNKVYISIAGDEFVNATDVGLTDTDWEKLRGLSEETDNSKVGVKIYLANSEHEETRTNEVETSDLLSIDNKAPVATIKDYTTTVYSNALSTLTFGLFKNEIYNAEISISDDGSGFEDTKQKYYVKELGEEIKDENLNKKAIEKIIREIDQMEEGWKTLKKIGETYSIPVGEGKNKSVIQNNYLIFIQTVDNAGNCKVYVSNGIVIEKNLPNITCTFSKNNQTYKSDKILGYQGDAEYELEITDPGTEKDSRDFFSGISKIEVTVTQDEVQMGEKTVINTIDENKVYVNSYVLEPDKEKTSFTHNELESASKLVIKGKVDVADEDFESNDVKLEVQAYDKAGNKSEKFTQRLILDNKKPEIDVKFNLNNETPDNIYYQKEREMTISYTEGNFGFNSTDNKNINSVDKSYVWFDLKREGDEEFSTYSLKELDDLGCIEVEQEIDDSQKYISDETQYTKNRKNKVTITFTEDNEYTIKPHCKDKFNNVTNGETYNFVIDKTAPKIKKIKYEYKDVDGWKEYDPTVAKSSDVRVSIIVDEHNFKLDNGFRKDQIKFGLTVEDKKEDDKTNYYEEYVEYAKNADNWSPVKDTNVQDQWEIIFTFKNDANYEWNLTYTDLAGRVVESGRETFTVDKTAPTGTIQIRENTWTAFADIILFGIFNNDKEKVTVSGKDVTAGVKSMHYFIDEPGKEHKGKFESLTKEELLNNKERWTQIKIPEEGNPNGEITLKDEGQYVIYTIIEDKAGNVTYINSKEGVIIDKTNPSEPQIMITTAEPAQGIYNGDVDFKINVIDPKWNGTYAGLEKVECKILNQRTETQSFSYNDELKDKTARVQSLEKTETIVAERNNSNYVTIQVYAKDYAGNETTATKDIKIDIKAPQVEIDFDNNNPLNGKYYKDTRTATIKVKERNFDKNAVNLSITNTDGTMPTVSDWHISPEAGKTDEAINYCTVTFAADGDYTMAMSCTDAAGNKSNRVDVSEFTIDKTVPTINVAFDNNNAMNGTYYNAPRTATITVNEHNFNAAEVQTSIQAALQSQGITAPGVSGWSTSGDTHTASVHFGNDGDYSFDVNYTDLAGNAAEVYKVNQFTIDQTKPEIEIFDIVDKSANNGTVAPGVKYSDVNYNPQDVNITIEGPKHKKKSLDGTRSVIPNGESIKMADFAHEPSVDDVYTLSAVVTDKAGNSEEKTVVFSVNRFGSNYIFGDRTKAFLDRYYSNEEQDLIITEINVDTLEHYGISYGRDGELETLKKGTDYTVKESGNEASWKSYQYTIKASNFKKEGLYNVTIDSRDRAKNEVNNKIKNANIEFVIDKTAPTVVITGIEDDEQYRVNERDITVAVTDNVAMADTKVYLDDDKRPAESYDAKAIMRQNGKLPFTLASSSDWQKLRAVATDAAGNEAETSEYRVLITSNILVQFYRNTPLVIGSSISILAVVALGLLLLSKKKKKEEA